MKSLGSRLTYYYALVVMCTVALTMIIGYWLLRNELIHGYYLEPFAKLLLAVAALRDNQKEKAREILSELHNRFPDNHLYSVELNRITASTQ